MNHSVRRFSTFLFSSAFTLLILPTAAAQPPVPPAETSAVSEDAQETNQTTGQQDLSQSTSARLGAVDAADDRIKASDIETRLAELDEAAKQEGADTALAAKAAYEEALAAVNEASSADAKTAKYQALSNSAEADIDRATINNATIAGYDFGDVDSLSLSDLIDIRTKLEQQLALARIELANWKPIPDLRSQRRERIPVELTTQQSELKRLDEELQDADQGNQAQVTLLKAKRQRSQAIINKLNSEVTFYGKQRELPRLQIDYFTKLTSQLDRDLKQLLKEINKQRLKEAERQQARAVAIWKGSAELVKPAAEQLKSYADRRIELAQEISTAAISDQIVGKRLADLQDDFDQTRNRTDTLSTKISGPTLVEKRMSLPSTSALSRRVLENEATLSECQEELYDWEERRRELANISSLVADEVKEMAESQESPVPADTSEDLTRLFEVEREILDDLLEDANRNYSLRISTREKRRSLITTSTEFRAFIDRNVFWLPTTATLGWEDLLGVGQAFVWLTGLQTLQDTIHHVARRAMTHPVPTFVLGLVIAALFYYRPRLRQNLESIGDVAAKTSCRSIWPTVRAMVLTVLLALPWPMLVLAISWLLSGAATERVHAISEALLNTSIWWMTIATIHQMWRPKGLAAAHFKWPDSIRDQLRMVLRRMIFVGTPLVFLGSAVLQTNYRESLGRLCLIGVLLLCSWAIHKITNSIVPPEQASRRWRLWTRLAVLVPLALAVSAAIGYNFFVYQMARDFAHTFFVVMGLLVLRALLYRGVRLARRSIRWDQLVAAREQRDEQADQVENAEEQEQSAVSDIVAMIEKEEETNLVAMDHQTRRLINLVIASVGATALVLIWMELLSALSPLMNTPINPFRAATDSGVAAVTFGAILLAAVIGTITVAALRNVPGLIDVLLLGRLGVESSIRYAITTLSQYAIAIVGIIAACRMLGITWDSVQWLVAAMGVGLGFGLQEVVANFICGIILLFERPIRVGDIVTMGDTTGVVVRIRSRATTIRNWDRQEVVIPNKELITGRITNWTLSDKLNRVVLNVGVAYGSNTDRVREVLQQILADHPAIMTDPAPAVTFEQFGDSTLNFVVRAFLQQMDDRMSTIHELHSQVNQRFAEEGIEIAFPQQDLHLRSVDSSIRVSPNAPWSD